MACRPVPVTTTSEPLCTWQLPMATHTLCTSFATKWCGLPKPTLAPRVTTKQPEPGHLPYRMPLAPADHCLMCPACCKTMRNHGAYDFAAAADHGLPNQTLFLLYAQGCLHPVGRIILLLASHCCHSCCMLPLTAKVWPGANRSSINLQKPS